MEEPRIELPSVLGKETDQLKPAGFPGTTL